jgi:hypothetical protein
MRSDHSTDDTGPSPTPESPEAPIPPMAIVMPGPSWALSNAKDTVPTKQRAAFYRMLADVMKSKPYAELGDLPKPWRERAMAEYRIWQSKRGS